MLSSTTLHKYDVHRMIKHQLAIGNFIPNICAHRNACNCHLSIDQDIFIIKHMALILCFNLISNVKSNCHIKLFQQCVCYTLNYNKNKLINKLNRFFALQIKSTWLLSPSVLQFTSQKTSKRYYMYLITPLGFLMILSNFFKSLHTFEKNSSNT